MRAHEVLDLVERWLSRPELGDAVRNVSGLRSLETLASVAMVEGDAATARAVVERIRRIPPERAEVAQLTPALEGAELRLAVIEGDRAALDKVGPLKTCPLTLRRGLVYARFADPRADTELREILGEGCDGRPSLQVRAHLGLAEAATDPAVVAAEVAAARALWPTADPDLVLVRRLDALHE